MSHLIRAKTTHSLVAIFGRKFLEKSRFLSTDSSKTSKPSIPSIHKLSSNLLTVKKDKDLELMDPELKEHKNKLKQTLLTIDEPMDVTDFNGVPEEHIHERRVTISKRTKNAMQSGGYGYKLWKIEFENRERWENPLMGWTSTGDPLSNLNVWFSTKEDAAEFCQKNGWYYEIVESQERRDLNKNYAENFSWNKRTRVGSK